MTCIFKHSIQLVCGHGIRKDSPGPRVKFSPIIIISRDLSNVKSIWQIFFASNFEPCVCAAIDTVSNFHISWKLQLEAGRRPSNFQADGSCNPCQIFTLQKLQAHVKFYMLPEAATAAFSRGRQLSWNTNNMRSPQNLNLSEKLLLLLLLLLLFPFYYIIFLKKFQIFFAHKRKTQRFLSVPISISIS